VKMKYLMIVGISLIVAISAAVTIRLLLTSGEHTASVSPDVIAEGGAAIVFMLCTAAGGIAFLVKSDLRLSASVLITGGLLPLVFFILSVPGLFRYSGDDLKTLFLGGLYIPVMELFCGIAIYTYHFRKITRRC